MLAASQAMFAHADIADFGINYTMYYQQYGSEPNATPSGVFATVRLTTTSVSDLDSASVSVPGWGSDIDLLKLDSVFYVTNAFGDEAEMLSAFPAGDYVLWGSGGDLGPASVNFSRPEQPFWPNQIPAFDPATYDAAQNVNPASDFTLGFNSWDSDVSERYGMLYVFDYQNGGGLVYWAPIGPLETFHTIQAGALPADRVLTAQLYFSSRVTQFVDSALSFVAYERATSMDLYVSGGTVCVGDLNLDGMVDDADFSIFVVGYNVLDCSDPTMPPGCPADFNRDGVVDDADFSLFVPAYDALLCPEGR